VSGSESERTGRSRRNPGPTGEAKREPLERRKINAAEVDWTALSPQARETLRVVGLRLAFGRRYDEIAEATALSSRTISARMRQLRAESATS
jgi:hypothetical protein